MSPIIFLLLGLVLLFLGGEILVKGSVGLALKMKISTLVVGLTIVSLATSSPELFVSLQAAFDGSTNISFGNVIGSNIANLSFVLGITAMIFRVKISNQTLTLDYPILFFSSVVLGGILYIFNGIPVYIGFLFIFLLCFFIYLLISKSRKEHSLSIGAKEDEILEKNSNLSLKSNLFMLVLGIFLLKYGADFLVESTKIVAINLGISDRVIAVTVVAIGTSIPELATSIIAAFRKEGNLAVGNLVGSNIFNILAVLGITASFKEINIVDDAIFLFDYFYMMVITFVVGLIIYLFSKQEVSRREGFLLLLIYLLYMYEILN